jgi:hypothetical protein
MASFLLGRFRQHTYQNLRVSYVLPLSAAICTQWEIQIMEGSDVNALDWEFEPPLIKAARAANTEIMTRLLEAGADANFICLGGTTALSLVSKACHTTLVSQLLCAGASIEGISLTDALQRYDKHDLDLLKILLKAGVDPNFSRYGEFDGPPLCLLADNRNTELIKAALPLLLEAGADVKGAKMPSSSLSFSRKRDGATTLHLAADHCNLFLIGKLLELGVALNACDGLGRTPLHRALCSGSSNMEAACSELIRCGAQARHGWRTSNLGSSRRQWGEKSRSGPRASQIPQRSECGHERRQRSNPSDVGNHGGLGN